MTMGEIQSIIWAKSRSNTTESDYDELLELLKEARKDGSGSR